MICALAIASVTRRTCVLSIILVVTIIRITQGIRSGGIQIEIFARLGEITAAARSLIDLYSNRAIAVSAICGYVLQNPGGLCGYQVHGNSGGRERLIDFLPDRRVHQI
ncbi:hypothetical protein QUA70_26360 [Microcoleus sp. LAD1_D5]|uniref:hypothetical protein n=1 Tax=unclassified Microcoleus TaxID=2642155 RepID=UPI002FCEA3F5